MQVIKSTTDFVTNIERSFDEIDPNWRNYLGIVVLGSHAPQDVDLKLKLIKEAREKNIPFLGICLGFQLAVIEYARNVHKLRGANSTEIDPDTPEPIIEKMPELRVGQKQAIMYGKFSLQSYWHNYKMNMQYLPLFVNDWWYSVNKGEEVVDMMVLRPHYFFVITQFHPEYQSSKDNPHPILKDFLEASKLKTTKLATKQLTPWAM